MDSNLRKGVHPALGETMLLVLRADFTNLRPSSEKLFLVGININRVRHLPASSIISESVALHPSVLESPIK